MINLNDIFDKDMKGQSSCNYKLRRKKNKNFFKRGNIFKTNCKNLTFVNKSGEKIEYLNILNYLKKEILELVKSQNIIDIGTPAFFNVNLTLKKQNDLFLFQNILNEIDLVENFNVKEFNNEYAYINIKYYGKINKIKEKLIEKGIDLNFVLIINGARG